MTATDVVYDLEGTLLEACSCGVLCPCWVGADPDGGSCDSFNAYRQCQAILDAYHGRLGGPLADLAGLVGEVAAVVRAPIVHEVRDGKGTLRIGEVVSAEMEPFRSPDGAVVTPAGTRPPTCCATTAAACGASAAAGR